MFWNWNEDVNHLANLLSRLDFGDEFPFQMGIRKVSDFDSEFGWVFLFSSLFCSLLFQPNLHSCSLSDSLCASQLWLLILCSNMCSAFRLSSVTSRVSSSLVVCVWAYLSRPVTLILTRPLRFAPLCTFCHCLSPPSLPLERTPVWGNCSRRRA